MSLTFKARVKTAIVALAVVAIASFGVTTPIQPVTKIKYGTLVPSGTVWYRYVRAAAKEVYKKSNKELKIVIYGGGKAGSEQTMLRKLRTGNLHMAAFTGIGLGQILPKVRVLELPFFFSSTRQVDKVVKKMYPTFEKDFDKKGFVLAGWGEAGWVYVLSKSPIRSYSDMKGKKVWAPAGDKLVKAMFQQFGLVPVFLSFEAVLPQLQTGGLDAVYAPPAAAIGFQWHREVKYVTNVRLANATGATLINKKKFQKLSPEHQKLLKEVSEKWAKKLIKASRRANRSAFNTLKKRGIKVIQPDKKDLSDLKRKARAVQGKLVGKLYSRSWLNKAKSYRK